MNYYSLLSVLLLLTRITLLINKHHVIISLLCLEFLVFLVLLVIYILSTVYFLNITLYVAILCFAARGAAVGLTLLVTTSRLHGNDKIINLFCEKNSWGWKVT